MTLHPTIEQPLTVKELAYELGVSVKYVELMHAAGFPMERKKFPDCPVPLLCATLASALTWREENEFRLVHCHPVLTRGQLRVGFRSESWTGFESVSKSVSQFAA